MLAIKTDILPVLNRLAYVFPVPYGVRRRLDTLVFRFVWAGKTELVTRHVMCRPPGAGGRGVPWVSLKALCLHVSFQARLVTGAFAHKAEILARFWLGFTLRAIRPLDVLAPWSPDLPWHYDRAGLGCGGVESTDHALWSCPEVVLVWSLVGAWVGPALSRHLSPGLVARGASLDNLPRRTRLVLWTVVSEAKRVIWERRTASVRLSGPLGGPQELLFKTRWAVWGYVRACAKVGGSPEARRVWGHLAMAVAV